MSNDLIRRLEALEKRLNAEQPAGLQPGEPLFATAGEHEWLREPGEELEAFAVSAVAGARELGVPLLVIGGLPSTQAQQDLAMAAYDAWLLTDDGVPPVTERGRR